MIKGKPFDYLVKTLFKITKTEFKQVSLKIPESSTSSILAVFNKRKINFRFCIFLSFLEMVLI